MKNFNQSGFTLTEILISLAVMVLLIAVVLPQFAKMRENQVLLSAVTDTVSSINKARSQTLSSLDSSKYGVRFESDKVVIFKGTSYSSGAADNETINITTPASITNVTLNGSSGSSGDFFFNRLSGAPSKDGTVTISTSNYSKIITISDTGMASIN